MKKLLALTTALSLGLGVVSFSVHAEDKAPTKEPAKVEASTTDNTAKPVRRAHRKRVSRHAHKKAAVQKEEGKDGAVK